MPSQEALDVLYRSGSEYVIGSGYRGVKKRLSIPERYVIDQELRAPRAHRSYLEIGVGAGLLFDYFRNAGYHCSGVEPGAWASSRPGLVRDKRDLQDSRYDVVVMADVLEHIRDPLGLVQFVSHRMESGTLYACFPNSQSLRARLATRKWRMVRPFGHLHFFSRQSLTIMFESAGLTLKSLRKTDLVDFSFRGLFWPPHQSLPRIVMWPLQRMWGDQWIIKAEKDP